MSFSKLYMNLAIYEREKKLLLTDGILAEQLLHYI